MTFLTQKTRIPQLQSATSLVGNNQYLYDTCLYPASVYYWNTFMNTYGVSTLPTVDSIGENYMYYNQIFNVAIAGNYIITYASDDLMTLTIDETTTLPQSDSITTAATDVSPYTYTIYLTQGVHKLTALVNNYRGGGTGFAIAITNSSSGVMIYDTRTDALTCYTCGKDTYYTTSSLYFNLDAKNPSSYPGTGTTWTDLTGNGHNFTLYNSPAWDSRGYFTFDGINDYAITPVTTISSYSSFSLECWYNFDGGGMLVAWTNPYVSYINMAVDGNGSVRWETGYGQNFWTPTSMTKGNWYHILSTYNGSTGAAKTYINGTVAASATISSTTSGSTNWAIGSNYNDGGGAAKGLFSVVRFYLKELSSSEVTQNYNAIRNRYCL